MCAEDIYLGWPNRETWALNLWLGNSEVTERLTLGVAQQAVSQYHNAVRRFDLTPTSESRDRRIGLNIVEWVEQTLPHLIPETDYRSMRDEVGSLWRVDHLYLGGAWAEALGIGEVAA